MPERPTPDPEQALARLLDGLLLLIFLAACFVSGQALTDSFATLIPTHHPFWRP